MRRDERPSERTRVRRQPSRGHYDLHTLYSVLDSAHVAHVAFVDGAQPHCIPMLYARLGGRLYVHGSTASRTMRILASGASCCVTVTVIDGLVLARSAFEHSANYRAAIAFGTFRRVDDNDERMTALAAFTDTLIPGRWDEVRPPSANELKATSILSLSLAEASVKMRNGPPSDDDTTDADRDIWAGVVPVTSVFGRPEPSPGLRRSVPLPASVRRLVDARSPDRQRDDAGCERTEDVERPERSPR